MISVMTKSKKEKKKKKERRKEERWVVGKGCETGARPGDEEPRPAMSDSRVTGYR